MKAHAFSLTASLGLAGLAVLGVAQWQGDEPASGAELADPIIAGTIPARAPSMSPGSMHASPPAVFSISNFDRQTVCLVERGATLTSRSRGFFAPPDCDNVWPGLAQVENWTQNDDGTVTLTNGNGALVLTLVRSKSFSYEVADPAGADIALLMLP
ncbi:hypothetical protein [Rhizobium sp. SL42]|uniref:hypothetical protein n=1 Tax=Rhizobium sp. SL42 TaxID=2806346 RepID=UPI001F2C287F|nr:hypothetical protein [Rhizobium sp. SL42]UJW74683.1 hypothetical protein IM739_17750 [Rhizobium sp. SL42]